MQGLYQIIKTDAHFSLYEADAGFSYYIYVKKYDILLTFDYVSSIFFRKIGSFI